MAVMSTAGVPLHQLTVETYQRIVESGALEDQRVELLDGIMSRMSPQSPEHAAITEIVARYLATVGRVRTDLPFEIAAADSLPEPDVLLTDEPESRQHHPRTALVVVEVSVSSQRVDESTKARLYAVAGVPVYWLIDVPGAVIQVRSTPVDGAYTEIAIVRRGEVLLAPAPGLEPLPVDTLLGAGAE